MLKIYDTPGQERLRAIPRFYYDGIDGVVLVYDISDRESFRFLKILMNDINIKKLLIGNKISEDKREITYEEGKNLLNQMK